MVSRLEIGQAEGILMERYKVPAEQAFELLRRLSQNSNRKLIAVAKELVATGTTQGLPRPDQAGQPGPPTFLTEPVRSSGESGRGGIQTPTSHVETSATMEQLPMAGRAPLQLLPPWTMLAQRTPTRAQAPDRTSRRQGDHPGVRAPC